MFENTYKGKRVVVTGHTGFKGSWLSAWLVHLGAEVYGISKDIPTEPSSFKVLSLSDKLKHIVLDIREGNALMKSIESINPNFIFHLAAQPIVSTSYKDPSQTFETNVIGTLNVLKALLNLPQPCSGVIITSDKCYENVEWTWGYRENDRLGGKDPYSASKAAAEMVIHSFYHSYFKSQNEKKIVSVRAGNVIGGGDWAQDRIVPDAARAWAANKSVTIRRPNATRPWQHVLEPLSGYLRSGQALTDATINSGESFNFGPGTDQNFSVAELLRSMSDKWFGQGTNNKVEVVQQESFHEAGLLKLNCDKAFHHLSWKPTLDFDLTTEFTVEWYKKFYEGKTQMYELTMNQIESYCQLAKQKNSAWTN